MFFLPWATGVVIMVLCCIIGVACLRFLPIWGGAVLGIGLYYLWETIMQINDYVSFWVFMVFLPGLIMGAITIYMCNRYEEKEEDKLGFWQGLGAVILWVLVTFPISAIIVNWIMGTFFNPTDHTWLLLSSTLTPEQTEAQLAIFQQKFDSYMEAHSKINSITDVGLFFYLGLAVLWFIFDCMKDRKQPNSNPLKKATKA